MKTPKSLLFDFLILISRIKPLRNEGFNVLEQDGYMNLVDSVQYLFGWNGIRYRDDQSYTTQKMDKIEMDIKKIQLYTELFESWMDKKQKCEIG